MPVTADKNFTERRTKNTGKFGSATVTSNRSLVTTKTEKGESAKILSLGSRVATR